MRITLWAREVVIGRIVQLAETAEDYGQTRQALLQL